MVKEFTDVVLAFGESDEYSFVLRRETALFKRRPAKIITSIVSLFTAVYVMKWSEVMVNETGIPTILACPPQFDGRVVCYPTVQSLRDYLSWRQADTHINNLYNTCFWALVRNGKTQSDAEALLRGTVSKEKNELLFSTFGINYNDEPAIFRKGSIIIRRAIDPTGETVVGHTSAGAVTDVAAQEVDNSNHASDQQRKHARRVRREVVVIHEDLIRPSFWESYPDMCVAPSRC